MDKVKRIDIHAHATAFPDSIPAYIRTGKRLLSGEEFQDRIFYGCDIVSNEDTHPFVFRDFLDSMLENGKITLDIYNKICRYNAEKILGWKGQEL